MKWPKKNPPMKKKDWDDVTPERRGVTQFIPREPMPRLGGKLDTTHLRFVDDATPQELLGEHRKIQSKESKLPMSQRNIITNMFK